MLDDALDFATQTKSPDRKWLDTMLKKYNDD